MNPDSSEPVGVSFAELMGAARLASPTDEVGGAMRSPSRKICRGSLARQDDLSDVQAVPAGDAATASLALRSPKRGWPRIGITRDSRLPLVVVNWEVADWLPDLVADLKIRAVLGSLLDPDFDGVAVRKIGTRVRRVDGREADRIRDSLYAIIYEAEPYGLRPEEFIAGRSTASRRPADREFLARLWESRIKDDGAKQAIRRGYFIARSKAEASGLAAFRDYCQIAGRPMVYLGSDRGLAEIEVRGPARTPLVITTQFIADLRRMIGEKNPPYKGPQLVAAEGRSSLEIHRLRVHAAEHVASWILQALSQ